MSQESEKMPLLGSPRPNGDVTSVYTGHNDHTLYSNQHIIPYQKQDSEADSVAVTIRNGVIPRIKSCTSRSSIGWNANSRLSFSDTVERITLTWDQINVYAPPPSRNICASCCKRGAVEPVYGKQILNNG